MTATLSAHRPLRLSGGAILSGLLFVGWLVAASSHAVISASVAAASAVSAPTHATVCKCAHCPGGAHCCCKTGATVCP